MSFAIEVNNLYFRYPDNDINTLHNLSLKVKKGEILAITGHSGCGKSTLCHIIAGIIPKIIKGTVQGEVLILGDSVFSMRTAQIATRLGIVFQEPDNQLFSPIIEAEVAFGPENLCINREEIGRRIEKNLELVGMSQYRMDSPNTLSGGQKQLIALASVLSMEPDILLFDEALSQIDKEGKELIKNTILRLKEEGKTILMVEHDFDNIDIADRIMVFKQGRLSLYEGELE